MVAIAAALGMLAGYKMDFSNHDYSLIKMDKVEQNMVSRDGRIEEILRFIETNYVDSLDQNDIAVDAIRHILRQLDPHSSYITAEELADHNEKMEGKYTGVGVETIELNDTFYITRVIEKSPAEKAGIQLGDAIISMNGDTMTGANSSFNKIRSYFKQDDGAALEMELLPAGQKKTKQVSILPEEIEVPSANLSFLLEDDVAYIKLTRFSSNTYEQFMQSIEKLNEGGNRRMNLVLDLRDNPGGYLPEAINILSQLFDEKGKLLCYTEGLNRKKSEYQSTGKTFYNIGKVVVLINEYSASGSEILAGAIQDWDRGVIIGQASYGKGLVQEIFPLKNGGALRLTVAKYYTPSGRLIQKSYDNINHSFEADTNRFKTILLEREVAGGGGIEPDIYVEDSFDDHCFAYADYIDYYLMFKMKDKGSNILEREDLSSQEMNRFVKGYFDQEIGKLEQACLVDIEDLIWSRYVRQSKGLEAYQQSLVNSDPFIDKAMSFIQDKKTTMALLSVEN